MPSSHIVILSDTHLGRKHCAAISADALRPLWQDASHIVINGDVAEVHHREHWGEAARQTMQLFDLCDADGVGLTLLSGNHDPYLSDIRHLHLANREVLVTHGDVMHPAVAPWSPASGRILQAHQRAIASLNPEQRDHLESVLSASQYASHEEWNQLEQEASHASIRGMLMRPWALIKVLRYWRQFPRLANEFTDRFSPESRFVVLGHTHHPGIWTVNEKTIINTGSFGFPGHPRAVILEDKTLSVWEIRTHQKHYELAEHPLANYELSTSVVLEEDTESDQALANASPSHPADQKDNSVTVA